MGKNQDGQLGINKTTFNQLIPQKILIQEKIISICCGDYHSISLSSNPNFIEYFLIIIFFHKKIISKFILGETITVVN